MKIKMIDVINKLKWRTTKEPLNILILVFGKERRENTN